MGTWQLRKRGFSQSDWAVLISSYLICLDDLESERDSKRTILCPCWTAIEFGYLFKKVSLIQARIFCGIFLLDRVPFLYK
jgi:hypothetical protein